MKTYFTIILLGILIQSSETNAQIIYKHTFPGQQSTANANLTIINMGNNEYKYFYVDYGANQLKLFNLDFTPYSSVNVPVSLDNQGVYQIAYVTRSLFDCDSTMFEYAITPESPYLNFYVYRQDGTLLFRKDSVLAFYCFGCYNGSIDVRPIVNTPSGAILFLNITDPTGNQTTTNVYSLCGTLPDAVSETDAASAFYVKAYPNPSNSEINFEFDLPNNIQNYELSIYDSSVKNVQTVKITGTTKKYTLDERSLSSGVYFFSLKGESKIIQTGKYVLNK